MSTRLEAVRRYQILGTPPEEAFDRITRLASDIFEVPFALFNIATGQDKLWCKSATGWKDYVGEHIQMPLCRHTMQRHDVTVVEDVGVDHRFKHAFPPSDASSPRFYAGAPIYTPNGICIGTLCILAPHPQSFSQTDTRRLRLLADLVVDLLEKHRNCVDTDVPSKSASQSRYLPQHDSLKEQAYNFSKLKESVLTNMSHEVRTPLTSMIGFAEILAEELDGRMAEHATVIYRCGQRLYRTLESMMQLSKLEGGVYSLNVRQTDLCEVVHKATELLRSDVRTSEVTVMVETPSTPVLAYADPEAVHRIVTNVLDNAIKFTSSGGEIQIRVHTESFMGACVEIEDTGVGISKSALPDIFTAFRQESEGVARMYEGIGLGLTIVKHLVERMGGVVQVKSQKGVGTHVHLHLPTDAPSENTSPS